MVLKTSFYLNHNKIRTAVILTKAQLMFRQAVRTAGGLEGCIGQILSEKGIFVPMPFSLLVQIQDRLPTKSVNGVDFTPVDLPELMHLRESMAPVLDHFGLSLIEVQQHEFRTALREAGPISSTTGIISPKLMAQNAVAAVTVAINGAETGTADNYKKVKTYIDGIGAVSTNRGLEQTGQVLSDYGYHLVIVATEGTASHSKPGESAIGNPTIPIGKMYPAILPHFEKQQVGPSGKVFTYKDLFPIFASLDVVEGTEIASTSTEAYQTISGRAGRPKDNGAVCLAFISDQAAVLADTYANKIIVSPEVASALHDAGIKLSLEDDIETTLAKISKATGRSVSDIGVMGLGLKPRLKQKQGEEPKLKNDREGRRVLFDKLAQIGITKVLTFDDGESPAIGVIARNAEVVFDNGQKGKIDVMLGPGGVLESVTAVRAIADLCNDQDAEYTGAWQYVSKDRSKKGETYFTMHQIPESEMGPYQALAIDPKGSQNITQTLPNDGERMFIMSSITRNPLLNPFAIAPKIDENIGTITVYQEIISSDGSVVGRYITLGARAGLASVRRNLSPVLPDIMRMEIGQLKDALQKLKGDSSAMEALRANLRMYLYSLVEDAYSPNGPPYYLLMNQLLLRRHVWAEDDQKALAVLRFATENFPQWFVNPDAVKDSKKIMQGGNFTVKKDQDDNPIKIVVNDPSELQPQGGRKK